MPKPPSNTTGTVALAFALVVSVAAQERFSGVCSPVFGMSLAGTGTAEQGPATGTAALAYSFAQTGQGSQRFSGAGASVFAVSLSSAGSQGFGGIANLSSAVSLSGSGGQAFRAAAGLSFPASISTSGTTGTGPLAPVAGSGGLAYGYSVSAGGATSDHAGKEHSSLIYGWFRKGKISRLLPGRYWPDRPSKRSRKTPAVEE